MKSRSKILIALLFLVAIIAVLFFIYSRYYLNSNTRFYNEYYPEYEVVSRAVDGDTFELSNGEKVRLVCVNTPEKGEFYYKEATTFLSNLVVGKNVTLIRDVSNRDKYKRLLRYAYLNGLNGTLINLELVTQGYARSFRYPPDVRECDIIESAERIAKEKRLGIWGERQLYSQDNINLYN